MSITTLLAISLGAILTNNFIFAQFLGCCPFLGVSKKIDTAVGMGAAVTFVMGLASAFCYLVNLILIPLHLEFMQTVAFILVIAGLVQFVEMFLKKNIPTLYTALGVYLPLITTNCACWASPCCTCRMTTTSSGPWSTASPVVWASCWPSSCLPPSASSWRFPATVPSPSRASPSRWSPPA